MIALGLVLTACASREDPPPEPASPPALMCSRLEPPPIRTIDGKFYDVGKLCQDPGGKQRYVAAFYQCLDGSIWPVLVASREATVVEPTDPAFDRCVGRVQSLI